MTLQREREREREACVCLHRYKVACLLSQLTHFLPNRFIASWLTSGGPFSRLLVELLSSCNQEVQCWAMDILAAAIR